MIALVEQLYAERPGGESGQGRCLMGTVRAEDEVPETGDGGGCPAVWVHFMPLN